MRTYTRKLAGKEFHFRLNVLAQKEMEKEFGEPAIQTILDAALRADKMTYLLGASAAYRGNENPTVDGDEIYDLLVDEGVCGQAAFLEEACRIAVASGVLVESDAERLVKGMRGQLSAVYDSLEEPNRERPTVTAGAAEPS